MSKNVGGKRQRSRVQGGWSNPSSSLQKTRPRQQYENSDISSTQDQKPSTSKDVVPSCFNPHQYGSTEGGASIDNRSVKSRSMHPDLRNSHGGSDHDGSACMSVTGTPVPKYLFQDIPRTTDQPQASGLSWKPVIPKNFSWVINEKVCAMAFPSEPGNLQYLLDVNVRYLISLTAERQPDVQHFPELTLITIKVIDFTPPSLEQIEQCLDIIERANEEGKAVGIHCAYGKGRTGTVLACYFIKYHCMNSSEALVQIRLLRPQSVETKEQEERVHEFEQALLSGSIKSAEDMGHCSRKRRILFNATKSETEDECLDDCDGYNKKPNINNED